MSGDHFYGAWEGGTKAEGGHPLTERTSAGKTAADKYGTVPMRNGKPVPITTKTLYHAMSEGHVQSVLATGFDLSRVKPRWGNDYAASTTTSARKAAWWFSGVNSLRDVKAIPSGKSILKMKFRGRMATEEELQAITQGSYDAQDYTRRVVHAGFDAWNQGNAVYVYNPDAFTYIAPIKDVMTESESTYSLRDDLTAALAEHGDPSMPNYAADYHPGPKGAGGAYHAVGLRSKTDDFKMLGGQVDYVYDKDRKAALRNMDQLMSEDPALEDDLGFEFTNAALGYGYSMPFGEGENVAPNADVLLAESKWGDVAGALALQPTSFRGQPYLFVPIMGSTGIIDGAGSAMARQLILRAAGAGRGVSLQPIESAKPFWESVGMHLLDDNGEHELWGMTPEETRAASKVLLKP